MENSTPSDSELLAVWLARRSEPAFRALVTRYAALVHMAAKRTCCDDALAADASQLVFILLAQKAKSLTSRTSLAGWLHIAAIMQAKRLVAKSRRETRKLQHLHTVMEPQMHSSSESPWQEIQPVLDQLLASLSEKDRETLLLKFYRSLSVREIATTLGIGADAAQKRLDRATERLRQKLTRCGVHTATTSLAAILVAGFANDAHAVSSSISSLTGKAVAASAINTSLSTTITLIIMTHKTRLTTAAAVVLAGTTITAALISGSGKNAWVTSSGSRIPRSSQEATTGFKDSGDPMTEMLRISCPRPAIRPEITALNEKFGEAQVKLARGYTQDVIATLQTKIRILDSHLEVFNPENKNEEQLAKMLFGEFSVTLNLSHEQGVFIKKNYSEHLTRRITNLTDTLEKVRRNSSELTQLLLYDNAKNIGKLSGTDTEYVVKQQELRQASNPLIQLQICDEFYVSSAIIDQSVMIAILTSVLNPQQATAYSKKKNSGIIESAKLTQPSDTAFIFCNFQGGAKLDEISKKMKDTRQEMDAIMQTLNVAVK